MFKKKRKVRTVRRRAAKKVIRRRKSNKLGAIMPYIGAGAYGAIRENISLRLTPLTARIPLGNIADEAGMLGLNYIIGRFVGRKIPLIKPITTAGMIIESARIGQAVAMGAVNLGGVGAISATNTHKNSFR